MLVRFRDSWVILWALLVCLMCNMTVYAAHSSFTNIYKLIILSFCLLHFGLEYFRGFTTFNKNSNRGNFY